jgi:hypothetical protein
MEHRSEKDFKRETPGDVKLSIRISNDEMCKLLNEGIINRQDITEMINTMKRALVLTESEEQHKMDDEDEFDPTLPNYLWALPVPNIYVPRKR